MATVRQALKDNIETALRAIDKSNGYTLTVDTIKQAPAPNPRNAPEGISLFLVSGDSELQSRELGHKVRRDEKFGIVGYIKGPEGEELIEELLGCIETALYVDIYRGGLCITSYLGNIVVLGAVDESVYLFEAEILCDVHRSYGRA